MENRIVVARNLAPAGFRASHRVVVEADDHAVVVAVRRQVVLHKRLPPAHDRLRHAEQQADDVRPVAAVVHVGARAVQLRRVEPFPEMLFAADLLRAAMGHVDPCVVQLADGPFANKAEGRLRRRRPIGRPIDEQHHAVVLRRLQDAVRLRQRRGNRFLDADVHFVRRRDFRDVRRPAVLARDDDDVQRLLVEHLMPVRVFADARNHAAHASPQPLVCFTDGNYLALRMFRKIPAEAPDVVVHEARDSDFVDLVRHVGLLLFENCFMTCTIADNLSSLSGKSRKHVFFNTIGRQRAGMSRQMPFSHCVFCFIPYIIIFERQETDHPNHRERL